MNDDTKYGRGRDEDIDAKIFVGGLSWQTTEQSLRYYFEKYGEIADAAIMMDKKTGQPRGFGFITMKDPAAADIIVSTEHTIDGRTVDVKRAVPREMAPAPSRSEAKKIFVGGLPLDATEKDFADYFGKYGEVKDAVVMVDRVTGRSRGFGFITFDHESSVEAALLSKNEILGKWVEIKRAEPRDIKDTPRFSGPGVGGYGGRGGGGMSAGSRYTPGESSAGSSGAGYSPYAAARSMYSAGPPGGLKYPAGYGGAMAGRSPYGMSYAPASSPYGYPSANVRNPAAMSGYYPSAMYSPYGASPYGAPVASYPYGLGPTGTENSTTDAGDQSSPPLNEEADNSNPDSSASSAPWYRSAHAAVPAGYGYSAAALAGYGGGYSTYGHHSTPSEHGAAPQAQTMMRPSSAEGEYGGNVRNQTAAQGRIDRSYRPY